MTKLMPLKIIIMLQFFASYKFRECACHSYDQQNCSSTLNLKTMQSPFGGN